MGKELHQFKLDNESVIKNQLKPFFNRAKDNIKKFYLRDNLVYDMSTLTNREGDKLFEVIMVLYYLLVFSNISGQSTHLLQREFTSIFSTIQPNLIQKLNFYIQNRTTSLYGEIYNTMNNNVMNAFINTINEELNDNGILQIQRFNRFSPPNGLYASKIVSKNVSSAQDNEEDLSLGELTASDLTNRVLEDSRENINFNTKEPVKRDLALGSIVIINQRINKNKVIEGVSDAMDKNFDTIMDRLAMTETQVMTETTRGEEIDSFSDSLIFNGEQKEILKKWNTVLDGRERPWHNRANEQTQPVSSPFIVNGEMLNFPGDTSLGASLNNIINCRCSATYS